MSRHIFQFKITLLGSKPRIWRRIQIADTCSFWDLHVAVQDSMGWEDYHLHDFRVKHPDVPKSKHGVQIGMPVDDGFDEEPMLAGWNTKVIDYLPVNKIIRYTYDYGDNWEHEIALEGIFPKAVGTKYPLCLDGENACPPEDCGGIHLYSALLESLTDKNHPDHEDNLDWIGKDFSPDKFDAKRVKFSNASARLKLVLEDMDSSLD